MTHAIILIEAERSAIATLGSDLAEVEGVREVASTEGVFAAPEGGACVAALGELVARGDVGPDERVVIFNTGSGAKYMEAFAGA